MKQPIYAFLIISVMISVMMLYPCGTIKANGVDMKITRDTAIEIANMELKQRGFDLKDMSVTVSRYNTPWNEYLPKDSTDKYYIERKNKLNNREYWAVYYYPNLEKDGIPYKGGDLCIFVDANTGEIITDIRWK